MKRQSGTALITALFIMAVCAALATAIAVSQRLLINEAILVQSTDQLTAMARGGIDWGLSTIMQMPSDPAEAGIKRGVDYLLDKPFVLNGIKIEGVIFPQQALFNLNALTTPANEQYFIRLLQIVIPGLSQSAALELTQNVYQWVSAPGALKNNNDEYYAKLKPPYRMAHVPFAQKTELRLVKGFSAAIYNRLSPYVTALPTDTKTLQIDVNYAPAPVLMLLSDKLSLSKANAIVACRSQLAPFKSAAALFKMCGAGVSPGSFATTTDKFYLLRGVASQGHQSIQLDNMVQLVADKTGKGGKFVTIWQAINSN